MKGKVSLYDLSANHIRLSDMPGLRPRLPDSLRFVSSIEECCA